MAKLAQAGKLTCCQPDVLAFAEYYAGSIYEARCYAREYLNMIANGDEPLKKAVACYAEVAQCLQPVWECFAKKQWPEADMFLKLGQDIRNAKESEEKGIAEIIIGKQRNGPIGICRLAFLGQHTRFENLSRGSYDEH